ncbi:MAG: insulinase family protein [Alphaproteobacteria bacterium]|nr:insulinase family protein [Alphaproteobacteria bacterium]
MQVAQADTIKLQKKEVVSGTQPEEEDAERKKVFDAESFTLDNGMEIVVIPNHRAPVITHMIWYKVGAADEEWGKSGIAHFLEHLMFKGSDRVNMPPLAPGEFSKLIRSMGGNDNAFTSHDYTAYFQSVASDRLEDVMRMEAGRINGMNPPTGEIESERRVVLEERRQRTDNDPRGQFNEQLAAAAFINHPYGIPVIGWGHEISQMQWADVKSFYDRWYAPNNAILVVSGDVSPADVFQKAISIYGSLPQETLPGRNRPQSPALNSRTTVTLEHPAIHEPMTQILYRVPSARQNKKESLALEVLAEIMGGGPSSRLYKTLVSEKKIATEAGLSYSSDSWDDASLWVYATPAKGRTPQDLEKALEQELRVLVSKGVTPEELADAKSRLQDEAAYALDSLTGPAMVIGNALATGANIEDVEYWPYDIAEVTAQQALAVARAYLNPDAPGPHPPVTGYLLPKAEKKSAPDKEPKPQRRREQEVR